MVYWVVMASEISSSGSLDLENVVGAEELSEDELELDDELDDDELDDYELDKENDICRLLAEVTASSGSLAGLLGPQRVVKPPVRLLEEDLRLEGR